MSISNNTAAWPLPHCMYFFSFVGRHHFLGFYQTITQSLIGLSSLHNSQPKLRRVHSIGESRTVHWTILRNSRSMQRSDPLNPVRWNPKMLVSLNHFEKNILQCKQDSIQQVSLLRRCTLPFLAKLRRFSIMLKIKNFKHCVPPAMRKRWPKYWELSHITPVIFRFNAKRPFTDIRGAEWLFGLFCNNHGKPLACLQIST